MHLRGSDDIRCLYSVHKLICYSGLVKGYIYEYRNYMTSKGTICYNYILYIV